MQYSELPDSELLLLLKAGKEAALEAIFRRYWQPLYKAAIARTHNAEAAEDLVQNLFVSLWAKRGAGDIRQLQSYLFTALKYQVINYFRSLLLKDQYVHELVAATPEAGFNAGDKLLLSELNAAIDRALAALPEKTGIVFRMSRFENRSYSEIAETLHLSHKSVEYHISQALKIMRLHLRDFIFTGMVAALLL